MPPACPVDCYVPCYTGQHRRHLSNATGSPGGLVTFLATQVSIERYVECHRSSLPVGYRSRPSSGYTTQHSKVRRMPPARPVDRYVPSSTQWSASKVRRMPTPASPKEGIRPSTLTIQRSLNGATTAASRVSRIAVRIRERMLSTGGRERRRDSGLATPSRTKPCHTIRCGAAARHFVQGDDPNVQFLQLWQIDRARRFGHHVRGPLCLGKGDAVADVVQTAEEHDGAVDTQGNATVRGRAILQASSRKPNRSSARPRKFPAD